jgi:hypothetical protein
MERNVNRPSYVFIDSGVEDYQILLDNVKSSYQVILLDKDRDGITQISEVLQSSQEVAEVHLVAHGSPGCLYLGNAQLDFNSLRQYAGYLQQWRSSLAKCADILIYGCRVAAKGCGDILKPLHALTGASIAASSQEIGNGKWELDKRVGNVKAALAFTLQGQQSYAGTLSTAFALSNNTLIPFDTANPSNPSSVIPITGLGTDTLAGIDFRPQNGKLYGIAVDGAGGVKLYAISIQNGAATQVGTSASFVDANGQAIAINRNATFGLDFNPTVDRIRVVNSDGLNFRINPNNGAAVDGNTTVAGNQPDGNINGGTTTINATAYTNNAPNVTVTTQYTLDANSKALFIQNPPNSGTQTSVLPITLGGSPLNFTAANGFDIPSGVNVTTSNAPATGQAFSALTVGGRTGLYAIELSTGAATLVGTIGAGTAPVQGFAVQSFAVANGTPLIGLNSSGQLLRFNSVTPGTAISVAIAGLVANETLVGIDFRPATGQLFALGVNSTNGSSTLYIIDPQTGAATTVGTITDATGSPVSLAGSTQFGIDFNPTVDRLRIVTNTGLNFRVNPNNGTFVDGDTVAAGVQPDGRINGSTTTVDATAYTNSFGGATVTTQYTLDANSDRLFIQNPPNNGTQTTPLAVTLNGSPLNFDAVNGFDIPSGVRTTASNAPTSGLGLAALTVAGVTSLYTIDLVTGAATNLGAIGAGTTGLTGLTAAETPSNPTLSTNFAANGRAVTAIGGNSPSFVQFSLTRKENTSVNELVAFNVDDDLGSINGIAPGAPGYLEAARDRARVIFSTIANNPNGFGNGQSSILDFGANARFSTFLIQNGSLDGLRAGQVPNSSVIFSNQTSLRVTDAIATGATFSFEDNPSNNSVFNDAVVRVNLVNQGAAVVSALQSQGQGELIDLRSLTGQVNATFTIYREAAFNNSVGFYRVVNRDGGIDTNGDGTADILPGTAGYTQAAINNRVASIDLRVGNQQTANITGQLTGGSIYVPFLIANGTVAEVVSGQKLNDVYLPFLGANADRVDHIRLLGNNTFGFEDLSGGGDRDFNDVIVQVNFPNNA